MFILIAD